MQPTQSRFLKVAQATPEPRGQRRAVPAPISRFLVAHPKVSRFIARIPGVSRFFALPAVATVPHIKPLYNTRARRPRPRPRYGL